MLVLMYIKNDGRSVGRRLTQPAARFRRADAEKYDDHGVVPAAEAFDDLGRIRGSTASRGRTRC